MPSRLLVCHVAAAALMILALPQTSNAQFTIVKDGVARGDIVVDARGALGGGPATLLDAGNWLSECIEKSSGVKLKVLQEAGDTPCVIIGRADAYPDIAEKAGLTSKAYDAFCIVTRADRLYLLGNSEAAARHAVATLLHRLGFRWFAPSPQWHFVPSLANISVDLNLVDEPKLAHRGIWYAYAGGEAALMENYRRWAIANRLSVNSVINTGHSYGNIIGRNQAAFDAHPKYFALLPDGKRDNERSILARKFCFSNQGLIDLVVQDRISLLEEYRRVPKGAKELIVDANPRLSIYMPGSKQRIDISPSSRSPNQDFAVILVPPEAAGKVWHTSNQTRGQVTLLNTPPLFSFHRQTIFVPREVAEADGLTTAELPKGK
jgi:hypothetical protein